VHRDQTLDLKLAQRCLVDVESRLPRYVEDVDRSSSPLGFFLDGCAHFVEGGVGLPDRFRDGLVKFLGHRLLPSRECE